MYSAITRSIESYAIGFAQRTLREISAALKIISRVDGTETVVYEEESRQRDDIAMIYINDSNFWGRILSDFDLGFAEAYMLQEIDCENLSRVFDLYVENPNILGTGNAFFGLVPRLVRWWRPENNITNALSNISAHYDTSNPLFSGFLSPDMNYSCAHWSSDPAESLESAQRRKVQCILKKAQISPSHHLLDIGCGWGDLLIQAARQTGCQATGLTLSEEQKALADQRIQNAGLQGQARVLLCDYRNAPCPEGGYDRIVSVGMFEHVGSRFLDTYFDAISHLLNPRNGVVVIDGATKIHPFHETNPQVGDYIDRYVFPGGYLPSISILLESMHRATKGSLEVSSVISTGPHYGKTLLAWHDNFLANWDAIQSDFCAKHPGASDVEVEFYRRRWLYYFLYCEAGLRRGILGNHMICAVRTPEEVVSYDRLGSQWE